MQGNWYRLKWDDTDPDTFTDLYWSSLEQGKSDDPRRNFFVPDYLTYGDYSGSSVEKANLRAFMAEFESVPGVLSLYGDFGSRGVAIREDALNMECEEIYEDTGDSVPSHECECEARHAAAMREFLDALDDYPVADEDTLSEVEMEDEHECWTNYGRRDFQCALAAEAGKLAGEIGADGVLAVDDDKLDELFRTLSKRANVYPEHETGGSVYFNVERAAAEITLDELRALVPGIPCVRKVRVRGTLPDGTEAADFVCEDANGFPVRDEDGEPISVLSSSPEDAVSFFASL